jgi:hypothetical protein
MVQLDDRPTPELRWARRLLGLSALIFLLGLAIVGTIALVVLGYSFSLRRM